MRGSGPVRPRRAAAPDRVVGIRVRRRRHHPYRGCGTCMRVEVPVDEFDEFVRARSDALVRTAYLLTGDVHLAEDLVQDVLARVVRRWTSVARAGDVEAYVRRALYHHAVDRWRARGRRVRERLSAEQSERGGSGDHADVVERRLVLRDALARLTARQRAMLILRFY